MIIYPRTLQNLLAIFSPLSKDEQQDSLWGEHEGAMKSSLQKAKISSGIRTLMLTRQESPTSSLQQPSLNLRQKPRLGSASVPWRESQLARFFLK